MQAENENILELFKVEDKNSFADYSYKALALKWSG